MKYLAKVTPKNRAAIIIKVNGSSMQSGQKNPFLPGAVDGSGLEHVLHGVFQVFLPASNGSQAVPSIVMARVVANGVAKARLCLKPSPGQVKARH